MTDSRYPHFIMAQKLTLEVIKKEQVTDKVYFVTFRFVSPSQFSYTSGQNMMLMIAPGVNRTMSIASPPSAQKLLMVHDVSPMGPGSQWTQRLAVGDMVTVVAPTGGALSFVESSRKKVMIATGTGIAPFHAMILDYLSKGGQALLSLYWGQRYEKDIYWKDEFDAIANLNPTFMWHLILSQPTAAWQGRVGHVTEHVLKDERDTQNSEFYLCGNKAMIEEVRAKLIEQGVPVAQIKTELFY